MLLAGVDRRLELVVTAPLMLEYAAAMKRPEHLAAAHADEAAVDVILDMVAATACAIDVLAIAEKTAALSGARLIAERAARANRSAFDTVIAKIGPEAPIDGDEL